MEIQPSPKAIPRVGQPNRGSKLTFITSIFQKGKLKSGEKLICSGYQGQLEALSPGLTGPQPCAQQII